MAELFPRRSGINVLADATIRMVVAFVVGELAERLLPLSRRFVPEPVQMSYILTSVLETDYLFPTFRFGVAACRPRALTEAIRQAGPWAWFNAKWDAILQGGRYEPRPAGSDDPQCSICFNNFHSVADIVHVRQVTLQTRLRLPAIPNSESFSVFISDRIEHVDMHLCSLCKPLINEDH